MGKIFNKVLKPVNKGMSSIFGDELGQALTTAGLVALSVYGGGAIYGAMAGAGGAAAGTTAAAAAGGSAALGSTGGALASIAGGTAGYQQGAAKVDAKKQEAAQADAQRRADDIAREQNLTRKKALLAEQTGLSGRANAARNVRNNLQGLASGKLGQDKEKLGGM